MQVLRSVALGILGFVCLATFASAQVTGVAGQNVNMVSGTVWPAGDPFLQRQNEPSVAVSTRNPQHLIAGSNDYRSVDIANTGSSDATHDAWLGVFTSLDGGDTWKSTLLPGYPQDTSAAGVASPLHNTYTVATDPTLRAGTHGLIYYTGLAFNRGNNTPSAVFVSTFQDQNNKGNGNGAFQQQQNSAGSPFLYLSTNIIDTTSNQFLDKPWVAVDIPRPGTTIGAATCNIAGQTITSGRAYVFYTLFNGSTKNPSSKINVASTMNCGATWSKPSTISQSAQLNQGSVAAIDPTSGTVYVAWRQIGNGTQNQPDQILMAYSTNGGGSWTTLTAYTFPTGATFDQDQNTAGTAFRTEDIPSLAVDGSGRLWIAFSQRVTANSLPGSRIYLTTFPKGGGAKSFTAPYAVDASAPVATTAGYQFMPGLTFAYGKLMLIWYDTRWDNQEQVLNCSTSTCSAAHVPIPGSTLSNPGTVFTTGIVDPTGGGVRHTVDVYGVMFSPAQLNTAVNGFQISQYKFYFNSATSRFEQGFFNPPNLDMFVQGTQPFIGDYIEVGALSMVPSGNTWVFNTSASNAPVFHAVWTDNRDVIAPPIINGRQDWTTYTPPTASSASPSIFNPSASEQNCVEGYSGDRNQNIYTSRITSGLVVGFRENAKAITTADGRRSFSLFVRNTNSPLANPNPVAYRILIGSSTTSQACTTAISGGTASFTDGSCQLDLWVLPRTTASRTIVVNSTNPSAGVTVLVAQISTIPNGTIVTGGPQATALLNADPTNPAIVNPDAMAYDPSSPDFTSPYSTNLSIQADELFDPITGQAEIAAPSIASPSIASPSIASPSIASPSIASPSIASPSIASPSIASPSIVSVQTASPSIVTVATASPSIASPSIASPSIANLEYAAPSITNLSDSTQVTDYNWKITNKGNTHTTYNAKSLLNSASAICGNGNTQCQLIAHKAYGNPTAVIDSSNGWAACQLAVQVADVTQANIPSPAFTSQVAAAGDLSSDPTNATVSLAPGEGTRLTLRVFSTTSNPISSSEVFPVKTVAVASTADTGQTTPPVSLTLTTTTLPVAVVGQPYTITGSSGGAAIMLQSLGGVGGTAWSLANLSNPAPVALPESPVSLPVSPLMLSQSGQISTDVVTASPGTYNFLPQVQDSAPPPNLDAQNLYLFVNQFGISGVAVQTAKANGSTAYMKAGDVATVSVTVNNQGPADATKVLATLRVNAVAGGTQTNQTPPAVSCVPANPDPANPALSLAQTLAGGSTSVTFQFNCTATAGNGYVSFTANATGHYVNAAADVVAIAPAVSQPTLTPSATPPNDIVDTTAPVLALVSAKTQDGNTYAAGTWTNQTVTLVYQCVDNLAGVNPAVLSNVAGLPGGSSVVVGLSPDGLTGTLTITLAGETPGANILPSCADYAANPAPAVPVFGPVRIDKTNPQLAVNATQGAAATPYNAGTWTNQAVTVTYTCADTASAIANSGVTAPPYPTISGLPPGVTPTFTQVDALHGRASVTLTAETAGTNLNATCSDVATNAASASAFGPIMIDTTPPVLTVTATAGPSHTPYSAGSWTNQTVTVTYACTDASSAVANSGVNAASVTQPQSLPNEGANQSASGTCKDNAGNVASNAPLVFSPINIDLTAPSVVITTPVNGAAYLLNSTITPNFNCPDALVPLDTNTCIATPTTPVTSTIGAQSFTVSSTDQAGNTNSSAATYYVTYHFSGFGAPLQSATQQTSPATGFTPVSPSQSGSIPQGQTVAVTWQLLDANNAPVDNDPTTLVAVQLTPNSNAGCVGPPPTGSISTTLLAGGAFGATFSYDPVNHVYVFRWDTTQVPQGCYTLTTALADSTSYASNVTIGASAAGAILLFSPTNVSDSSTLGSSTSNPVSWAVNRLTLTCPAAPTAVLSSTPDGTGTIITDDYIAITSSVAPTATNVCTGGASSPVAECYSTQASTTVGQPANTAYTGVQPLNIATYMTASQADAYTFALTDVGFRFANDSVYLITNCH